MELPLVSIVILSYERKETLRLCLERAVIQDYPQLEVLVVDNASTDGSDRMVEEEFSTVRLIRLPQNIGCGARNIGVAAAKGEIVITIDNDVLLGGYDVLKTAVGIFEKRPSVACINFKVLDAEGSLSHRDWCHPREWRQFSDEEFLTDYVLEGASAFRREAFFQTGGYWPPFFIGHEGWDLALRMLNNGYELLYSPRIRVTHLVSAEARPRSRIYYSFTRNSLWVALRNHRPLAAVRSIAKDLLLMSFSSARAGRTTSFLHGLYDGVKGAPAALSSRRPLHQATYRKLAGIRSFQPSLIEKARRHWQEQLI